MKKLSTILLSLLMTLLFSNLTLAAGTESNIRLGAGLGPAYGYIGGNIEFNVAEHFAFTTGAGYSPDGFNWLVGGRIYFLEKTDRVRPRLGFYYGTVLVEYTDYFYDVVDYDTPICSMIGIGLDIKLGTKASLDSEMIYIVSDDLDDLDDSKEDLRGKICTSLGVHW